MTDTKQPLAPFVSAVIPCRNEGAYIDQCLSSLVTGDYPKNRTEIIVVDGMSTDKTREIVKHYSQQYPYIKLLDNPQKILASAWNIGIKMARGDIVMALNAHGVFANNYISQCVHYLSSRSDVDYVGGIVKATPKDNTFLGRIISLVLSHPFGVGNSYFRTGTATARLADTAAFGGYRREVFEKVGLFNEELTRSQDMEFHLRLKKAGCKILLVPSMHCDYYTRSTFKEFLKYSYLNGFWITYPLKFASVAISLRHVIPLFFVAGLIFTAGMGTMFPFLRLAFFFIMLLYLVVALYHSMRTLIQKKDLRYLLLPLVFLTLHISYGIGSLFGLLQSMLSRRFWRNLHTMWRTEPLIDP